MILAAMFLEILVLTKEHPRALTVEGDCRAGAQSVDRVDLFEGSVRACGGRRCTSADRLELTCARAKLNGRSYGPAVSISVEGRELRVIARVELEEYVAGVVASEDSAAPPEAKRALAILARTYALGAVEHPRHGDAPLCDLTHCQSFQQIRAPAFSDQTVLADGDRLAPVFFHSTCGGRTIDAHALWPDLPTRSIAGVEDPFCAKSPHARWVKDANERALGEALALDPATLFLERARPDGSVWRIGDAAGERDWSGEKLHLTLARKLGFGAVKSSDFTAIRAGSTFRLSGRGLGHRVGLCQHGAAARAEAGQSAEEILRAYFPNLRLVERSVFEARPLIAVEGRSRHLETVRAACAEIERELGAAKRPFRVELAQAETIEEFVAKSGRSRAEAAALAGRTIWLQPDGVLEKLGDLAPIARHECVHVWLRSNGVRPLPAVLEEALALGFSGQAAKLPPAPVFTRAELARAEQTLASPKTGAELERALARAVRTVWPIARAIDPKTLIELLAARDWTETELGRAIR